jgi:protein O-mannosyl-transferase
VNAGVPGVSLSPATLETRRAALLVCLAAVAAYANSITNQFAFDDMWFIVQNDVVTQGRYVEAFTRSAWPGALEGTGNYRPLVLSSFALEWSLGAGAPIGFHLVSVGAHALVSLLVFFLLALFTGPLAGAFGGIVFAIHPVHTEAVANVMGRAELYAALGYLGACLVYLRWDAGAGWERAARLLTIGLLYLVSVGSKEIGVTLPAVLILLEVARGYAVGRGVHSIGAAAPRGDPPTSPLRERLAGEATTYVFLLALLGCYVVVRANVLGSLTGESAAAGLISLDSTGRVLSALAVWPEYLRLLLFPVDLSADYAPAVLIPTSRVTAEVLLGAGLLISTVVAAVRFRRTEPVLALGFAWFIVTISPVSNLVVRSDVLLAERTLYLPSVGLSLVLSAIAARVLSEGGAPVRRVTLAAAVVISALLTARTVTRNPTWKDTFTALQTLAREHPESWLSQRTIAINLQQVGDDGAAAEAFEVALALAPDHYQLLVDAAEFYERTGSASRSEELLEQAIELLPGHPVAYRRLAEYRVRRGDGRGAHAVALRGVAAARPDRGLWELLSESYVMKSDLEAAARARRAAIGVEATGPGWNRLGELLAALGRPEDASAARAEALRVGVGEGATTP